MSEMPDKVYLNDVDGDGIVDNFVWSTEKQMGNKGKYIRADIAETLYDALKMACMQDCGWVMHAQAAIEAHRKAKGE